MSFDLLHIWQSMGLLSRTIAGVLVFMAVATIAVTIERMWAFTRSNRASKEFASKAGPLLDRWDLPALIALSDKYPRSALAKMFGTMARRYSKVKSQMDDGASPVELVRKDTERVRESLGRELRQGMAILASVGSVAPFVGLLGTVVGIIGAFQGIAATGSGGLGAVSVGIAEALVETALGLMVAIPAVLLFNYLTQRVSGIELNLARSAGELLDEMEINDERVSGEHAKAA